MPIKDFDKVVREERKIKLAGETADVSKIPSRVVLEIRKAYQSGEIAEDKDDSFEKVLGYVAKVLTPSNPKMDADFLLDNADFETLMEICEYVLEPLEQKINEQRAKAGNQPPGKKPGK